MACWEQCRSVAVSRNLYGPALTATLACGPSTAHAFGGAGQYDFGIIVAWLVTLATLVVGAILGPIIVLLASPFLPVNRSRRSLWTGSVVGSIFLGIVGASYSMFEFGFHVLNACLLAFGGFAVAFSVLYLAVQGIRRSFRREDPDNSDGR